MTSSQGVLFCQNKSELSNLQNGHREKLLFFTPHFWPFKKHWTGQKSYFLIRRVLKKPFFSIWPPPRGSYFAKIRVSCQTFKMDIEKSFCFLIPHFWPFKKHWTGQKSCFLIRRVLEKPFFSIWPPPRGTCFAKIRVSCQTFKMDIERNFCFLPPIFDHLKSTGQVRNLYFLIRRVLEKSFFSIWPPPRGSCFAKIRVSCQTFKMDIERSFCFLTPHFWPFKKHWTGQKSYFLIRRVLKSLFSIWPAPRGSSFAKIRVSFKPSKWT